MKNPLVARGFFLFSGINEDIGGIVAGNNAGLRTVNAVWARSVKTEQRVIIITFDTMLIGAVFIKSTAGIHWIIQRAAISGNIREALFLRRGCRVVPRVGVGRIRRCGRRIRDAAEKESSVIGDGKISWRTSAASDRTKAGSDNAVKFRIRALGILVSVAQDPAVMVWRPERIFDIADGRGFGASDFSCIKGTDGIFIAIWFWFGVTEFAAWREGGAVDGSQCRSCG